MRWKRVEITAGALLLWALLYYLDSDGMVMLVLSACTLHELGHYIAIRLLGGQVARLRITCPLAALWGPPGNCLPPWLVRRSIYCWRWAVPDWGRAGGALPGSTWLWRFSICCR